MRHLTLTPADFVYTCDIDALDKKITALAEQSHLNDAAMYEEYATVNEVNEVLANNYVLKSDISESTQKVLSKCELYISINSRFELANKYIHYLGLSQVTCEIYTKPNIHNLFKSIHMIINPNNISGPENIEWILDFDNLSNSKIVSEYFGIKNNFNYSIKYLNNDNSLPYIEFSIPNFDIDNLQNSGDLAWYDSVFDPNSSDINPKELIKFEVVEKNSDDVSNNLISAYNYQQIQIEELKKENDELKATIALLEKAF